MKRQRQKPGPKPDPANKHLAKLYIEIPHMLKAGLDRVAQQRSLTKREYLQPILQLLIEEELKCPWRGKQKRIEVLGAMLTTDLDRIDSLPPRVQQSLLGLSVACANAVERLAGDGRQM